MFSYIFTQPFLQKFSFLSLIKACTVFLASLCSTSSTLNLDFLNFLNNLSRAVIFSAISPWNWLFVLFFTLIVFVGATLFTISKKKCILRSSVNFTYRYSLGFWKEQIYKDDSIFLERIFLVLKQMSCFI